MNKKRVAYIGCGAVVERSHLPALSNVGSMSATVLVDFNKAQRAQLASLYEVNHQGDSISAMLDQFDIGVIATPSASHYALAKELLRAGKHVLVEKPLTMRYSEAVELVDIAKKTNLVLAVSLIRHYLPHYRLFKTLIESSVIGKIHSFHIEEGGVFNWPVQGDGFFKSDVSGGGVLMDTGAHLLDACLWWLGNYDSVEYFDDYQGGVEADCHLSLNLKSGVKGIVKMSRLRNLANCVRVDGEKGSLDMGLVSGKINLSFNNSEFDFSGQVSSSVANGDFSPISKVTTLELFEEQYHALNATIDRQNDAKAKYLVLGDDCLESVRLIEDCYDHRQQLSFLAS